jgi:hypothetical protein
MLGFLPPVSRCGVIAFLGCCCSTPFSGVRAAAHAWRWCGWCCRSRAVRVRIDPVLNAIATAWIAGNSGWMRLTQRTAWDVAGIDGARLPRLVPGELQSPELGRHLRAAAPAEPAHPAAQVLPQAAADLGAGDGAGLVGARLPVHAPPLRSGADQAPREAPRGSRDDAACLRQVRPGADQRDELRRRHALHAGQARTAALALPSPAQAARRRAGDGAAWRSATASTRCST